MERSFLFVPGNRPERFDKACATGAHAVILDLEDAVAPADKAAARGAILAWLGSGKRAWIRMNGPDSEWFALDLPVAGHAGVIGIMVPKSEAAAALRDVRRHAPGKRLVPLIESGLGLHRVDEIAAEDGVERLAFGTVDFGLDLGIEGDGVEIDYGRSRLVLASRVAGRLAPIDGVTLDLDSAEALAADVKRSRRFGMGAKLCIHPKQVAGVNAGFAPSAEEIAWARLVVEAAAAVGDNALRVDGKLVDRPVIERARALLSEATP